MPLSGTNNEACHKIAVHADHLIESVSFMQDGRDETLHAEDIHDQFKAIAKLLGYTVTREKLS